MPTTRLSEQCQLDGCDKPWEPMQSFMIGPRRYRFCCYEHLREELDNRKCSFREKAS